MSDHTLRLIKRLLDLADEQNRLAVGASWEHRSICATVLEDAAKELGKLDRLRSEVERLELEVKDLRATTTGPAWDKYHDAVTRAEKAERERDEARAEVEAAGVWAQHLYKQCGLEPGTDASIIELVRSLREHAASLAAEVGRVGAERDKAKKEWQSCWEKVQRQAENLTNLNTRVNQLGAREAEQRGEIAELTAERNVAIARAENAERERDEARAKVEDWCRSYSALHDRFDERIAERDAARTEVARLRAALDSIQHASSGFERCTEVVGESLVALREQLGWINMRAREALK